MSLADRLTEATAPRQELCRYAHVIAEAREKEPDATDELVRLVSEGTIPPAKAALVLSDEGYRVGETTVRLHRNGECMCR